MSSNEPYKSAQPNTSHGFRLKGSNNPPLSHNEAKQTNNLGLNQFLEYNKVNDIKRLSQTAQGGKRSQRRQIITKSQNPSNEMSKKIEANKYISEREMKNE